MKLVPNRSEADGPNDCSRAELTRSRRPLRPTTHMGSPERSKSRWKEALLSVFDRLKEYAADDWSKGLISLDVCESRFGRARAKRNTSSQTLSFHSRSPHLSLIHISEPTRRTPISYA